MLRYLFKFFCSSASDNDIKNRKICFAGTIVVKVFDSCKLWCGKKIDQSYKWNFGMNKHNELNALLEKNKKWAANSRKKDPEFFARLSHVQSPKVMWIGCSDSRVPANEITGLLSGELFVHRNVANVVVHADLNCLSVLQYAVDVLKVTDVIVCGHYGCGGVKAVFEEKQYGLVDNWLKHVADIRDKHMMELKVLRSKEARFKRLCEINVQEQANNVCQTTVVQDAWKKSQDLSVHAVIYDIHDGLLKKIWSRDKGSYCNRDEGKEKL